LKIGYLDKLEHLAVFLANKYNMAQ